MSTLSEKKLHMPVRPFYIMIFHGNFLSKNPIFHLENKFIVVLLKLVIVIYCTMCYKPCSRKHFLN